MKKVTAILSAAVLATMTMGATAATAETPQSAQQIITPEAVSSNYSWDETFIPTSIDTAPFIATSSTVKILYVQNGGTVTADVTYTLVDDTTGQQVSAPKKENNPSTSKWITFTSSANHQYHVHVSWANSCHGNFYVYY